MMEAKSKLAAIDERKMSIDANNNGQGPHTHYRSKREITRGYRSRDRMDSYSSYGSGPLSQTAKLQRGLGAGEVPQNHIGDGVYKTTMKTKIDVKKT